VTDDRQRRAAGEDQTIVPLPGQAVRSPELVTLELPIAGPTSRMLAYAIDFLVILTLEVGLGVLLFLVFPALARSLFDRLVQFVPQDPKTFGQNAVLVLLLLFALFQLAIEGGYFVFSEMTMGGRSLGKAAVGLRVVRDGGFPISLRDSLVRNLLRMVDLLPGAYAIGLVTMVASPVTKRLGDLAAGTIVIRLDRPARARPLPAAEPGTTSAFRFERDQVAHLGRNELALLRQTLRRAEALAPEQAEQALERAVTVLCTRIGHGPVAREERRAFLLALLDASRAR
jgi:uncharacterized RDD family membrane protein YckC